MSLSDMPLIDRAHAPCPEDAGSNEPTGDAAFAGALDAGERLLEQGGELPTDAIRRLLSLAVRLFAALVEETGDEGPPTDRSVSTTDAIVTAVALLRAHNLTAFETAVWFSRSAGRS
jgi:hypothetical protein